MTVEQEQTKLEYFEDISRVTDRMVGKLFSLVVAPT